MLVIVFMDGLLRKKLRLNLVVKLRNGKEREYVNSVWLLENVGFLLQGKGEV